jgi:hypothetical protein
MFTRHRTVQREEEETINTLMLDANNNNNNNNMFHKTCGNRLGKAKLAGLTLLGASKLGLMSYHSVLLVNRTSFYGLEKPSGSLFS